MAAWGELWNETYGQARSAGRAADPRFDTAGWNDSYTGALIPQPEMREWLEECAERVLALGPKRVLEIGVGTGMVLFRLLDKVEHYTGVDVSAHALEGIRRELSEAEAARVTLVQRAAHALEGLPARSFDTVILNSVVQYFPDAGYLERVLRAASELVCDGGRVIVGDVRSLAQQRAFHTLVELQRAPSQLAAAELAPRIERRMAEDGELTLSDAFFHALQRGLPRIAAVDVGLKRARARNEMSCFRYDVVLHVGEAPPPAKATPDARLEAPDALPRVRDALASRPPLLLLTDVENARLSPVTRLEQQLERGTSVSVAELQQQLAQKPDTGIDPGALAALDDEYWVDLCWAASGDPRRFDAVLRHKQRGPRGRWPFPPPPHEAPVHTYASSPFKRRDADGVVSELRTHLREFLPEYMVPAAFVLLDALPLTPNGKIDRKALPSPDAGTRSAAPSYQAPRDAIEQTISELWQQLLGSERVGRKDNIFDLGANSLLTVQAHQQLSAKLGRKISLVSMFRYPTVEALAAHLGSEAATPPPSIERRELERQERKQDAVARRRALRQERNAR